MNTPDEHARLAQCLPPSDQTAIGYQDWHDLLFLHWEMQPEVLARTLPPGLNLDLFEGRAFLGIVPFFMRNVRPRFCPAITKLSNFLEMNLRTYVFDEQGRPGVWFYSLDASQEIAVGLARRLFHLPYQHAIMTAQRDDQGWLDYRSRRAWTQVESRFRYRQKGPLQTCPVGTLEFFLAERYLLFTRFKGRILSGRVFHPPYPLSQAEVEIQDQRLFMLNGFIPTDRPADHAHYSPGVSVHTYPLKRVCAC